MLEPTEIPPTFSVSEHPADPPEARRYELRCSHGVSSALMVPAGRPLGDQVVLDLLLARHHSAWRCRCQPTMDGSLQGLVA